MMAIESCLKLILSKVDVFENLIPYQFDSNLNLKREIYSIINYGIKLACMYINLFFL